MIWFETMLKAKASSVLLVLGGSMYSNNPFVHPVTPGPSSPQEKALQWLLMLRVISGKSTHSTSVRHSKALISLLVSAVEPPYLAALQNTHTSILVILQHLFSTYKHITPKQLKARKLEIFNMNQCHWQFTITGWVCTYAYVTKSSH